MPVNRYICSVKQLLFKVFMVLILDLPTFPKADAMPFS